MNKIRCMGCMEELQEGQETCPHCGYKVGTQPVEVFHLRPGTILANKYLVGKAVGYGGFGVTYIGYDTILERRVAIKEYLPGEFATRVPGQEMVTIYEGEKHEQFDSGIDKFIDEAKRLGKFNQSEGIVHIYDSFFANATAYIVMEYIDGITLKEKINHEGKLSLEESLKIITPIINALKEVHKENILHRDIAPDNIMIGDDGKVSLIDFGASRFATTTYSKSLSVLIKAGYAPVEQYQSRGNQGTWSDVYSLAATFYTMLTGVAPQESIDRGEQDLVKPPSKMGAKVSKNMDNAIMNALNLKPENRTQTMEEFENELFSQKEVIRIFDADKREDIGKWPRWVKVVLGFAGIATVGFLALVGTGILSPKGSHWESDSFNRVVPNFVNMDYEDAYAYAEHNQINTLRIPGENDEQIKEGAVLKQSVAAGSQINSDLTVELTVSLGRKMIEMPKVTALSLEEAKNELSALGFSVNDGNLVIEYVEGLIKDQVWAQDPKAYESVPLYDTVIKLQVLDGTLEIDESILVEVPQLVGMDVDDAKQLLAELKLRTEEVSIGYSLEHPVANQVVSQSIEEGKTVSQGTIISFEYSLGDTRLVPGGNNRMKDEVIKELEDAQFKVEEKEVFADAAKGMVIEQSPSKGMLARIGTKIVITVSKGPDPDKQRQSSDGQGTEKENEWIGPVWELPSGVSNDLYDIKDEPVYDYRDRKTTSDVTLGSQGWELESENRVFAGYGAQQWSDTPVSSTDLIEADPSPKTQYRSCQKTKETRTYNKKSLDGWIYEGDASRTEGKEITGEWTRDVLIGSETESQKVWIETRNENTEPVEVGKTYLYHVYHYTYGPLSDGSYFTNELWKAEKWGYDNEDLVESDEFRNDFVMGYDLPGAAYPGAYYAVKEINPRYEYQPYTEYRSHTIPYSYSFYRWVPGSTWSEWDFEAIAEREDLQVETKPVYGYKEKLYSSSYTYLGPWKDAWTKNHIEESDTVRVRERKQYYYRKK